MLLLHFRAHIVRYFGIALSVNIRKRKKYREAKQNAAGYASSPFWGTPGIHTRREAGNWVQARAV